MDDLGETGNDGTDGEEGIHLQIIIEYSIENTMEASFSRQSP